MMNDSTSTMIDKNILLSLNHEFKGVRQSLDEVLSSLRQEAQPHWDQFKERARTRIELYQKAFLRAKSVILSFPAALLAGRVGMKLRHTMNQAEYNLSVLQRYYESSSVISRDQWGTLISKIRDDSRLLARQLSRIQHHALMVRIFEQGRLLADRKDLQWGRKIFHTLCGLSGIWLFGYSGLPDWVVLVVLGSCLFFAVTTEIARRVWPVTNRYVCKALKGIMRERERTRISSATWYMGSILFIFLAFPKEIALISLFYVAVGDTAAGIFGVLFGKHRLSSHVSLEGLLASFIACFAGTLFFAGYAWPAVPLTGQSLWMFSIFGGVVGSGSECLFKKWDDNLVIPLVSAPALLLLRYWLV